MDCELWVCDFYGRIIYNFFIDWTPPLNYNTMKLKKSIDLDMIAEEWSGAYRADYNGRDVSCEIIRVLLEKGYSEEDAKEIYFSKHLRWFFDSNGVAGKVKVEDAAKLFKAYLKKNEPYIQAMFQNELMRKLVKNTA